MTTEIDTNMTRYETPRVYNKEKTTGLKLRHYYDTLRYVDVNQHEDKAMRLCNEYLDERYKLDPVYRKNLMMKYYDHAAYNRIVGRYEIQMKEGIAKEVFQEHIKFVIDQQHRGYD